MSKVYQCKHGCHNVVFPTYKLLNEHKRSVHGVVRVVGDKKKLVSPLDQIHSAELQIREAIKGLESERDLLHDRIVEIDNMVAKYQKWTGPTNGDRA